MSDVECPYCGRGQEINHDDGYGYSEDETHNQECRDCGKVFTYTTSIMYLYEPAQAECLNGGEHNWQRVPTYPIRYTKMRCSDCGEIRPCTDLEMDAIRLEHHE